MERIQRKPMLEHVYSRVQRAGSINHTIIASTHSASDDVIVRFCKENCIPIFKGESVDVLDRYYQAALVTKADVIVRITADCPLIDPKVIDDVVTFFLRGDYDYASNTQPPTYPDGQDCEVVSFAALKRSWEEATFRSEREHVMPYITKHPDLFRIGNLTLDRDLSKMRWTVDTPADLDFVRAVFQGIERLRFGMDDVLALLTSRPELMGINKGQDRNEGYIRSLKEDST